MTDLQTVGADNSPRRSNIVDRDATEDLIATLDGHIRDGNAISTTDTLAYLLELAESVHQLQTRVIGLRLRERKRENSTDGTNE